MSPSKTKPSRRTLSFHSMDDLLTDAKALAASGAQASGGWTTGQVIWHVAAVIESSVEGFTFTVPLPMRILGRLIRNRSLKKGIPAGVIKIPRQAQAAFLPPPDVKFDDAVAQMTAIVEKAKHRRMNAVSPIFGALTHDQWVQLHCRHAEMHFSFLSPVSQPHDASHAQSNGRNKRHAAASA